MSPPLVAGVWAAVAPLWALLERKVWGWGQFRITVFDCVFVGAVVVWAAHRAHDLRAGSEVNRGRLLLECFGFFLVGLWIYAVTLVSMAEGLSPHSYFWYLALLVVWSIVAIPTACVGGWVGAAHGRRELAVERSVTGSWILRGTLGGLGIWLLIVGLRIGLEDAFLKGYSVFLPIQAVPTVPVWEFVAIVLAVGELYLFGFGFEFGYNVAIWRHRRERVRQFLATPKPEHGPVPPPAGAGSSVRPPFVVPTLLPPGFGSRSGGQVGVSVARTAPAPAPPAARPAGPSPGPAGPSLRRPR